MKVLIAEDVPVSVHILRNMLERLGHTTLAARDGQEALEKLEAHPEVGCAFVDVNMPGVDGLELVRTLRDHPHLADLSVVFVTGSSDPETVRAAASLKCIGYLLKPVSSPARVSEIMDRARAERLRVCDSTEEAAARLSISPATAAAAFARAVPLITEVLDGLSTEEPSALTDRLTDVSKMLGAERISAAIQSGASRDTLEWEARALLNMCRAHSGLSPARQRAGATP
jgi:CheY-like chemotaxis protein